jgi:hypothetical protein
MKCWLGVLFAILSLCAANVRAQEVELGITREDALTFYAAHNFTMHSHKQGDSVLFSIDVDSVMLWGIRGSASLIFNPREIMVGFVFTSDSLEREALPMRYDGVLSDLKHRFGAPRTTSDSSRSWGVHAPYIYLTAFKDTSALTYNKFTHRY